MSDKPINPQPTKNSSLPQNIPITYLWFGKSVPEDYLISLADLQFPLVFLKNPKINRKFNRQIMDVEKSDYYRLQYLYEYGGIYSDLDNIIDYPCLMTLLEPFRSQDKVVFQSVGKHTRQKMKQMTNGMIFAPRAKMPIMKRMIDQVDETKRKIWDFAGLSYLGKFTEPIQYDMTKCVIHTGDWSWFEASNAVLKKNTAAHDKFAKKKIKKIDFIQRGKQLEDQLKELKSENQKIVSDMNGMIKQNNQVVAQLKDFGKSIGQKHQKETNINSSKKQTKMVSENKNKNQYFTNNDSNYVLNEVKTNAWNRQKLTMQSYIGSLEERNSHLKQEKDIVLFSIAGLSIFLLVLMVLSSLIFRKKMNKKGIEIDSFEEITTQKQVTKF